MKSWKMALTQVADLKEKMQRAGIGGIGKTSLSRHVFGLHFSKFDKSSFIEGISTKANERFDGLHDLQKQLHGVISKKIDLQVNDVIRNTSMIENVLARKRVFIVLDDIDSLKQLDALLGNKGLHPGSKVIITTKDASLTNGCALFKSQVYPNHKKVLLNGLYKYDSLKLLCIHAFDSQNPKEGYEVVSKKFVKYCNGLPLAIEVLGRSLQNQDVAYWEECIKVLKREPHSHINKALKMSFDALLFENDKELFKHIACFFVGTNRYVTETILNSCDLNARSAITNLVDRCLLSIGWNNELIMHQLVQEMGRDLVRQESPDKPMEVVLQEFSRRIKMVMYACSPLKSIPLDLPMENLVVLDMSYSNVESLDMSYGNLQPPTNSVGGFFLLPALERLILRNCIGLIEVIPSDLKFSMIPLLSSLRILSLANNNLSNECFPMDLSCLAMLEELRLDRNPIVSMPSCVRILPRLMRLHMNNCYKVISIEDPPSTPRELSFFLCQEDPLIREINFDREMSPLNLHEVSQLFIIELILWGIGVSISAVETHGMIKIQSMASVEEKVLHSLCWTNLDFSKEMIFETFKFQILYEFGVFSTFYPGKEMPEWINCRSNGPSISFTIPSSPNNLRGLNFCSVERLPIFKFIDRSGFKLPLIKISNITKNLTWIYKHCTKGMMELGGSEQYFEDGEFGKEYCFSLLSYWMFGPNDMKAGDHITITVSTRYSLELTLECGIDLVYDDGSEDVLGCYKSWNHVIGGDIFHFQTTTEDNILHHWQFWRALNVDARLMDQESANTVFNEFHDASILRMINSNR
ncbi:hypothetical protein E3N88_13698 [Mikania micrantha]|uniref:Uncharacterized protein n=1 Tax=Mikania micrantha TaxID=192012 RepID=A0A5N6P0I6_9ASTR|nr:hypothetical protein E3N88_13698 [Mikania micrantha]